MIVCLLVFPLLYSTLLLPSICLILFLSSYIEAYTHLCEQIKKEINNNQKVKLDKGN